MMGMINLPPNTVPMLEDDLLAALRTNDPQVVENIWTACTRPEVSAIEDKMLLCLHEHTLLHLAGREEDPRHQQVLDNYSMLQAQYWRSTRAGWN